MATEGAGDTYHAYLRGFRQQSQKIEHGEGKYTGLNSDLEKGKKRRVGSFLFGPLSITPWLFGQ